ncbi:hypothetical protein Tco_0237814 [Tanacetum coccineum]
MVNRLKLDEDPLGILVDQTRFRRIDIMADLNIPVEQAPVVALPTRTDDQILPLSKWVPVGKSNSVLDGLHDILYDSSYLHSAVLGHHEESCYGCTWKVKDRSSAYSKCQVYQTDHPSSENQAQHSSKDWFASSLLTRETFELFPDFGKGFKFSKYQQFLDEERGKAQKGGATESSEPTKVSKPKAAKATKPAGDKAPRAHRYYNHPKPKPSTNLTIQNGSQKRKSKLVKKP